ncbi:MAG: histidine phosphatase family protein [Lachnospiraceae bacterium]|nr:histidine phosphatase family protein [Lachnospiraceae bacterium]
MKILIIRHGDPDYVNDSLTEKGWREAEYLSERLAKLSIRDFYVSPLGRAKDTADPTLKKLGRTAAEREWLREFAPRIKRPDKDGDSICWDWLPQDWTGEERFYRYDEWWQPSAMSEADIRTEHAWVTNGLDGLLAEYGYVRDGHIYRVEQGNNDTIALFCHYGSGCVLVGHLIGVSPMVLWHGLCAAPSSVTTVVTEERRKGIASFRVSSYGDISHLYAHEEPPAFAARFTEKWENDERHD